MPGHHVDRPWWRRERNIRIGDTVAVFAQGPIGLCATAGAKLCGATNIIAVESIPERLAMARRLGADHVVNYREVDPVDALLRITDGRGVDVAIEALGVQSTFEACLRVLRPGGRLSSLGVYSSDLRIPLSAIAAGLGDTLLSQRSARAAKSACAASWQ